MTNQQKVIIGLLSTMALLVMGGIGCALFFLVMQPAASQPTAVARSESQQPAMTTTPPPTQTPRPPTATSAPTQTAPPTPTGTRVVVVTVPPSPTPTRANCINQIKNFEASGKITSPEVTHYLQDHIPTSHLDHCRKIEYIPKRGAMHGTDISGNIIPVYREIYVYATNPEAQTAETVLDTLVHEIGHNVHMNIRRDDFELDVRWAELHRQSQEQFTHNGRGFVSGYAQTSKFEDFAESYRAYIRQPETLIYYSPDKYEFMRTVIFAGRQY